MGAGYFLIVHYGCEKKINFISFLFLDGSKSIEGTVFSIIAQSLVPSVLSYFGKFNRTLGYNKF